MQTMLRGLLALLMLLGLAACSHNPVAMPATRVTDSQLSFNRTFNMALASMTDQRMVISEHDLRQGRIVGSLDGITVVTSVRPMVDGTTRVTFVSQGQTPADTALIERIASTYTERMAKVGLLGGFNRGGDDYQGPIPCPSGPAFCN
ncbi:MAG: hypothetical protein J0M00_13850 [Burkholderiales bacterium]|nr:hypothetical protein [Burkholderiales bacterium]